MFNLLEEEPNLQRGKNIPTIINHTVFNCKFNWAKKRYVKIPRTEIYTSH
jgi:hypothetical protein